MWRAGLAPKILILLGVARIRFIWFLYSLYWSDLMKRLYESFFIRLKMCSWKPENDNESSSPCPHRVILVRTMLCMPAPNCCGLRFGLFVSYYTEDYYYQYAGQQLYIMDQALLPSLLKDNGILQSLKELGLQPWEPWYESRLQQVPVWPKVGRSWSLESPSQAEYPLRARMSSSHLS